MLFVFQGKAIACFLWISSYRIYDSCFTAYTLPHLSREMTGRGDLRTPSETAAPSSFFFFPEFSHGKTSFVRRSSPSSPEEALCGRADASRGAGGARVVSAYCLWMVTTPPHPYSECLRTNALVGGAMLVGKILRLSIQPNPAV